VGRRIGGDGVTREVAQHDCRQRETGRRKAVSGFGGRREMDIGHHKNSGGPHGIPANPAVTKRLFFRHHPFMRNHPYFPRAAI